MKDYSIVKNLNKSQINQPLVSVIVCTYQHVNYISRCLEGILMQETDFPFEIILGEDESSDGTREICIDYANKYPKKIKLFLRKREDVIFVNSRPTGRYNFLKNYEVCLGKYIAVCDGDDAWCDVKKLQKQVNHLEINKTDVISCHNAVVCDKDGKLIQKSLLDAKNQRDFTGAELICGKHLSLSSVLFRNILGKLPHDLRFILNADTFIFMLLGFHGNAKFQTEVKNNIYTLHTSSLWSSQNFLQQQIDKNLLYKTMFKYCHRRGKKFGSNCLIRKYLGTNRNLIIMNFHKKQNITSLQYFLESFVLSFNHSYFNLGLKQLKYFVKHFIRLN